MLPQSHPTRLQSLLTRHLNQHTMPHPPHTVPHHLHTVPHPLHTMPHPLHTMPNLPLTKPHLPHTVLPFPHSKGVDILKAVHHPRHLIQLQIMESQHKLLTNLSTTIQQHQYLHTKEVYRDQEWDLII